MAMVGVDSGSQQVDSQPKSFGLDWVGGCLAPFYVHQMHRVNSCNGSAMMRAP